ncbi:MAG: exosortase system-associated protein, TIGR04073 family [Ignavibacteria bacterium]|nr:exosortase system-associated protein, TIGR04073 family [Ignavibacteria bacterium]
MRILTILLVILFVSAGSLRAENPPSYAEDVVQDMSTKLTRGVFNVLTGWGEIPRQMIKSGHDKGWWAVLPVGIPAGVIMGIGRTGVGAFETLTFFIPIHESYAPVLEPAFVWQ